jgi:hypothetical protein
MESVAGHQTATTLGNKSYPMPFQVKTTSDSIRKNKIGHRNPSGYGSASKITYHRGREISGKHVEHQVRSVNTRLVSNTSSPRKRSMIRQESTNTSRIKRLNIPLKKLLLGDITKKRSSKTIGKNVIHNKSIDEKFRKNWKVNHGTQYYVTRGISREISSQPVVKQENLKSLLFKLTKKENEDQKLKILKEEKLPSDILITDESHVNLQNNI